MVECDPDKCSVEKRVEKSDRRAPKRSLWCALRQEWWHSVAHFRVVPERLASVAREPENARLGGCAGRLQRTCLRHQIPCFSGKCSEISFWMPLPWKPLLSEVCSAEFLCKGQGIFCRKQRSLQCR